MSFHLISKLPLACLKEIEGFNVKYNPMKHSYAYFAKTGNIDGIKWLYKNRKDLYCGKSAMDYAASNGHFNVVKWLHANRTEGCTTYTMDLAAENGFLDIVKWLHNNRTEGCTSNAIYLAADSGFFNIVKWLHDNYEGSTELAIDNATEFDNFDMVQQVKKYVYGSDYDDTDNDNTNDDIFGRYFDVHSGLYRRWPKNLSASEMSQRCSSTIGSNSSSRILF